MMRRSRNRKGSTALEFVLIGIPMIFVLISLFEIARGMWMYQTIAYAVREGSRYASMHGSGCATPNTCQVTVAQIAGIVKTAGAGIDLSSTLTLTPATGSATSGTITTLLTNNTKWPPTTCNTPGNNVTVTLRYSFRTILAIFWPGSGQPLADNQTFSLPASSTERIQF